MRVTETTHKLLLRNNLERRRQRTLPSRGRLPSVTPVATLAMDENKQQLDESPFDKFKSRYEARRRAAIHYRRLVQKLIVAKRVYLGSFIGYAVFDPTVAAVLLPVAISLIPIVLVQHYLGTRWHRNARTVCSSSRREHWALFQKTPSPNAVKDFSRAFVRPWPWLVSLPRSGCTSEPGVSGAAAPPWVKSRGKHVRRRRSTSDPGCGLWNVFGVRALRAVTLCCIMPSAYFGAEPLLLGFVAERLRRKEPAKRHGLCCHNA